MSLRDLAVIVFGILVSGVLPGAPRPEDAGFRVWTLSSWERVLRSDPPGSRKAVILHAAGREWESFQVAVRSQRPVRILSLELSALRGEDGAEIPRENLRAYRAHQLHVTEGTYRNKDFREGWYPDALIPFVKPGGDAAAGGRLRALPFDLPAGQTHTFWVDVHVPAAARAGDYRGRVVLKADGGLGEEIPVTLRVWPFDLPERASMKTEFGAAAPRILAWCRDQVGKGKLERAPGREALEAACARLTTEHRFNSYPPAALMPGRPSADGSFRLSPEQVAGWKGFLSSYHVNALAVPSPNRYFKDPVKDRDAATAYLRSWDRALEAMGRPDLLCYTYLIDEPNDPKAYEFTRVWGRLVREARSRVKVLVTEQTKPQDPAWGDLYGAVDIWVPLFSLFDPQTAAGRQALGESIWTYTALCQGKPTPWWHIDYPLLNYRVTAWMAWLYRMKGLLYWGGMSYWKRVEDPWTQPETYGGAGAYQHGKKGRVYNGEGSLLYPGSRVGIVGPVPSMRLKALRDGLEDYDYLMLLESLGRREVGRAMVQSVARSWYDWSRNPESYVHTRRKFGCLIADALKKKK